MGQQQLLLVILVTILVGIATVVAINVFGSAAENANRDAVRQDLIQAASSLQAIWARPLALGGVSGDFADTDILTDVEFGRNIGIPGTVDAQGDVRNENATYAITRNGDDQVTIVASPLSYQFDLTMVVQRTQNPVAGDDAWTVTIDDAGGQQVQLSGPGGGGGG